MKNIVITGAASGIGKALSEIYLKQGHKVYGLDLNREALEAVQLSARKMGYTFAMYEVDVTDHLKVAEIVQDLEAKKIRVDIWINGAGINGLGEFEAQSKDVFDRTMSINFTSVVDCTRLALNHMNRNGFGFIVNIASVAGFVAAPLMSAYAASKHAVVGFTRAIEHDLRVKGSPVRTLMVSPGFVDTAILNKGHAIGFPHWMSPILSKPESVARDIVNAVEAQKSEIVPTLNGKTMLMLNKLMPAAIVRSANTLGTRSLKDILLNRY